MYMGKIGSNLKPAYSCPLCVCVCVFVYVVLFGTVSQGEKETGEHMFIHTHTVCLSCSVRVHVCVSARPLKYPVDSNQIRDDVSSQQTDQ